MCADAAVETITIFEQQPQESKRAAVIKFGDHSNASKWVAAASKKETYNLLDSGAIAKLLLSE